MNWQKNFFLILTNKTISYKNEMVNKQIKKENLPQKICIICNRPFTWRKKWEKVWDEVKYCSDKCRGKK